MESALEHIFLSSEVEWDKSCFHNSPMNDLRIVDANAVSE